MDKINFLLEPKNTNYSNKIKNANGSYNVVLSIPKSVEEQILKGNFNIQPSALETLSRKSNADDLGNHTAYMTLDLDKNAIINVSNISAAKFNGLELDIKGLANFQSGIRIPEGAAEGYILSSDADGNASWQALSVVMNGDNLGTHQASQDLDMQGHNISNADLLQVETVVVNGAFALKAGAGEGFVLSSDAAGNASWQPLIRADVNGDDLGDHIASQDLDLNGNDIVSVNEISADVLRTNVLDVTTVDTGAQIHSPTLKGLIDLEGTTSIIGSVNYAMPSINGSNLINIDWLAANFHEITLNGDVSLNFSNAPANTAELTLIVNQDETGSRTISYPDAIKWPTGMAPVLSSSANAIDIIDCLYNANSTDYLCSLRKADYQ